MAERLDQLKQKYQSVLNYIPQSGVQLQNVHLEGDKLLIRGVAPSLDSKNRIWDQIKLVDPNYSDLVADITVSEQRTQAAGAGVTGGQGRTYTVQSGDSLSKIASQFYGDASQYIKIFNANRDKLTDPNRIQPGQQLTVPE